MPTPPWRRSQCRSTRASEPYAQTRSPPAPPAPAPDRSPEAMNVPCFPLVSITPLIAERAISLRDGVGRQSQLRGQCTHRRDLGSRNQSAAVNLLDNLLPQLVVRSCGRNRVRSRSSSSPSSYLLGHSIFSLTNPRSLRGSYAGRRSEPISCPTLDGASMSASITAATSARGTEPRSTGGSARRTSPVGSSSVRSPGRRIVQSSEVLVFRSSSAAVFACR